MFNRSNIDVVDLEQGRYVFISPNRINFISDINKNELDEVINEELEEIRNIQEKNQEHEIILGPSIAFIPTLDCNLRCIYCYARGGEDKVYMSLDLAMSAIDAIASGFSDPKQEYLSIYFVGGGEPFLNFRLMEKTCSYAREKFSEIEIIIVSNGTFGAKQLDWLIQNKVATRISYDGVAHSIQRPFASGADSSQIVEDNIRRLVKYNIPLTVQLTITDDSVLNMAESVRQIANLGVKYVKIEPVHYSIISRGSPDLVPKIDTFVEQFLSTILMILDNDLDIKIDNSFISRPTAGYYCGAGEGSNLTITPSGDITACLEITRRSDKYSNIMMYGQCLANGFKIDKNIRKLLDRLHWSNYRKCKNCNLKLICGGGCPMQGGWDNGDLFIPSDYNCTIHQLLLPELFRMVFDDSRVLDVIFTNHTISGC